MIRSWCACRTMSGSRELLQKDFLILLLLYFVVFFAELIHLHELDLVGVGERRIYAFAIDELAGRRLDLHAFLVEEEVDKGLAGVGPRSLGSEADVLTVAEHVVVADIIETRALFVVSQHEARKGDADGCLSGTDSIGGRHDGLDEYRFRGGEIV